MLLNYFDLLAFDSTRHPTCIALGRLTIVESRSNIDRDPAHEKRRKRRTHVLFSFLILSFRVARDQVALSGEMATAMTPKGEGDVERAKMLNSAHWTVASYAPAGRTPSCNWSPLNCRSLGNCPFFAPALRLRSENDEER